MNQSLFEQSLDLAHPFLSQTDEDLLSRISPAALKKLKSVAASKTSDLEVVFLGLGSSFHTAAWGAAYFKEWGIPSLAMSTWDALNDKSLSQPHRFFILISHRGARDMTKALAAQMKSDQFILLCSEKSPTAGAAAVYTCPSEVSKSHSFSLFANMAILSEILNQLMPSKAKRITQDRALAAHYLSGLPEQESFKGIPKLKKASQLIFIGAGPFESMAHELALKSQEMAHIPALSFGLEQFLHGPLACISPTDHVILLRPSAAPGMSAVAKSLFISRFQQCRQALMSIDPFMITMDLPPLKSMAWQAALALAYGQRICLQYALHRKTNVDSNRQDDPVYAKAFKLAEF